MIVVLAKDPDGVPRLAECSICKSRGIQPAIDLHSEWLRDWAASHRCVPVEVHHRSPTRHH